MLVHVSALNIDREIGESSFPHWKESVWNLDIQLVALLLSLICYFHKWVPPPTAAASCFPVKQGSVASQGWNATFGLAPSPL